MNIPQYYAEICKIPLLSKAEEEALFKEYYTKSTTENKKKQIRDLVIRSNLRFAFKQAKFHSSEAPGMFEELISAGNEGLTVAFDKYSPKKNVRFLTYAGAWVVQRIKHHMSMMRIVSLPTYKQQICARIDKLKGANPDATRSEIIQALVEDGVSDKHANELYDYRFLTYHISDLTEDNFLSDPISEEVDVKLDNDKVRKSVSNLPSPHREIMARLYGFIDGEEQSIITISKNLRIPKDDVIKYRDESLEILRDIFT